MKNAENKDADKENRKQIVNPIVPVAQFEAFKVYEDRIMEDNEEQLAAIDEKLMSRMRPTGIVQVYKGTAEDRFYTKSEVAELERVKKEEDAKRGVTHPFKELVRTPEPSPMSVEKVFDENSEVTAEDVIIRGVKSPKDLFFEMEEYRADIYRYLREHEVKNEKKSLPYVYIKIIRYHFDLNSYLHVLS